MKRMVLMALMSMAVLVGCDKDDTVYVCTGDGAYAWHCKKICRGLKSCDGQIVSTTVDQLSGKYKHACEICY